MRNHSLAVICIALGWSIPFVYPYAGEPLSSFYNDALAMGFGLAACVFLLLRPGPLLFPRALVAPVGLVVLIVLQILLGRLPYPQWGLLAANFLLWASVMMMAGARLEAEWGLEKFAAPLAWALVAGGFANSMVSVAQAAGIGLPFWLAIPSMGHSVYGNLAQTNHLADYTSLATASRRLSFRDPPYGAGGVGAGGDSPDPHPGRHRIAQRLASYGRTDGAGLVDGSADYGAGSQSIVVHLRACCCPRWRGQPASSRCCVRWCPGRR